MNRIKAIIISAIFCLVVFGLTIVQAILPDEEVSVSERRKKQQFPQISITTLTNGEFSKNFEKYLCDQFPLRDTFRQLKAFVHFNILRQKDNNSVYIADGYVSEIDSKLNTSLVEGFCDKITNVYDYYIKNTDCKAYYSIIPDKNRFLAEKNGYPAYDYGELYSMVDKGLSYMTKIEIESLLSADCYYRTDSHWRQEKIIPVAQKINEEMGMEFSGDFKEESLGEFYGVYYSRAALSMNADELICLRNDATENSITYNYETKKNAEVYNKEKLEEFDRYDVFLSGAVSIIEVTNLSGDKDKELVVFRDSFGSSITPLLLSTYSKVTLVDTRYVSPELIGDYVKFDNQDVLFIYSTMLVNNSATLR